MTSLTGHIDYFAGKRHVSRDALSEGNPEITAVLANDLVRSLIHQI